MNISRSRLSLALLALLLLQTTLVAQTPAGQTQPASASPTQPGTQNEPAAQSMPVVQSMPATQAQPAVQTQFEDAAASTASSSSTHSAPGQTESEETVSPQAKAVAAFATNGPVGIGGIAPSPFCRKDQTSEVVAFCPYLSSLQDYVNTHPGMDPADLQNNLFSVLNYLNPGNAKSVSLLIAAIKTRMATQQVTASALQAASQAAGQLRSDQQLGAVSSASGSTSLVTKAGSAELLSLAVDTGALTHSVNGSTATLTANADELYRLITNNSPDCLMNCGTNGSSVSKLETYLLDPLNLTASLAIDQSSSETAPSTGQASGAASPTPITTVAVPTGAGKLTAITAKYQVLNKYDPHSTEFRTAWASQVNQNLAAPAASLTKAVVALLTLLQTDPAYKAGASDDSFQQPLISAAMQDHSGKALVKAFESLWSKDTSAAFKNTSLPAAVAAVVAQQQLYAEAWSAAVANAAGTMFSVQYTFNKPLNQPQTHDITAVLGYKWGDSGSLTSNLNLSIYQGSLPSGANYGRIHYGQASLEYERVFTKSSSSAYQTNLSLAGYWQYQPQPSVLNIPAGTVVPGTSIPLANGTQEFVGTAGSLWVTQGKLTIKGPGGINIPLGVSWSNKTDLLQGSKVGGQVGISYDFSSVAGLF